MFIHIITPKPDYIFIMILSYSDFIFSLEQKMCSQINFYLKNVLTHTFYFPALFLKYKTYIPTNINII